LEIEVLAPRYTTAPMQWLRVILAPEVVDLSLDRPSDPARLLEPLRPYPEEHIAMHPVARAVGNVRNEGAELTAAVANADANPSA
jgi:putative SOS response-associated peptidase YedK